jgi:site-specific DNA-cytosine methylase
MTLTNNELRARAAAFAADHAGDAGEIRHTQTFWNDFFFNIFGVKRERVATILTKCDVRRGAHIHLEQSRALTGREAVRLKAFPYSFNFKGRRMNNLFKLAMPFCSFC